MSTNEQKYLVLRGKNKDIYFMQKRLSKVQAAVYGKEFIKKSLETKDLNEAMRKRDEILKKLDLISLNEEKNSLNELNIITIKDQNTSTENYMSTNQENELSFDENFSNNVPIASNHNNFLDKDENQGKYSIFSLKLLKIPEKEDLIVKIDKIIPIAIVLITLFIALIA